LTEIVSFEMSFVIATIAATVAAAALKWRTGK